MQASSNSHRIGAGINLPRALLFAVLGLAGILLVVIPIKAMRSAKENPETGYMVDSRFVVYYKEHGGQEIFGYPISEAFIERDTDKIIQYFENARLEMTVDNLGEMQVKTSALGMMLGGWEAPIMDPGDIPGCRFFQETGHQICHMFLEYYDHHGGSEVFGFPIAEIELEDEHIVQYFQWFRLDWAPNEEEQGEVRPGPLGLVQMQQTHPELSFQATGVGGGDGLLVTTSVENASTPSTGEQTIYLRVRDQNNQPLQGATATLVAHFPEGARTIVMPLTDVNGRSQVTFLFEDQPAGISVNIDLTVFFGNLKKETRESFMISYPESN